MISNLIKGFKTAVVYYKRHWKCFSLIQLYFDIIFGIIFALMAFYFPCIRSFALVLFFYCFFDSIVFVTRYSIFRDLSIYIQENGVDSLDEYIKRNH